MAGNRGTIPRFLGILRHFLDPRSSGSSLVAENAAFTGSRSTDKRSTVLCLEPAADRGESARTRDVIYPASSRRFCLKKGLLIVNSGKEDAAGLAVEGLVLRALGRGFKVCVILFSGGDWKYGGPESSDRFKGLLEIHFQEAGADGKSQDPEQGRAAVIEAWVMAKKAIESQEYRLVVLDDLPDAILRGILPEDDVVGFLAQRPGRTHVAVTGDRAPDSLISAGGLVTEGRSQGIGGR